MGTFTSMSGPSLVGSESVGSSPRVFTLHSVPCSEAPAEPGVHLSPPPPAPPQLQEDPCLIPGRGREGQGLLLLSSLGFRRLHLMANIPLFPGAARALSVGGEANCELSYRFSYEKWEFIFILILLCDELSVQMWKWKKISKPESWKDRKFCDLEATETPQKCHYLSLSVNTDAVL